MEFNPPAERKHELINGYINSTHERPKGSLCRFYLRGLCLFEPADCKMSHGIDDLLYSKSDHNNNYKEEWGSVVSPFNEKPLFRGALSYLTLYKTQEPMRYSLQEINSNKPLRHELRRALHRREFDKFMRMLKKLYQRNVFKEEFLEEEYYRVGFNKLMTRIKYGHLIEYLCDEDNSLYFKVKQNKQAFIAERMSQEQTLDECSNLFNSYLREFQPERIVQAHLRGWMYKNNHNLRLPPMNMLLTWLKLDFSGLVAALYRRGGGYQLQPRDVLMKLETNHTAALTIALQYISASKSSVIDWSRIVNCVNQGLGVNNATVAESLKIKLIELDLPVFYLPMSTIVYNSKFEPSESVQSCRCGRSHPQLKKFPHNKSEKSLKIEDSPQTIVIFSQEEVERIEPKLFKSGIVGVDVEGRLKKNASIEIVQVRAADCIFLFDFLSASPTAKQSMKLLLRNLFMDSNIVKVFHDSRHDSLAIHEVLGCCIVTVLDTSALDIIQQQRKIYQEHRIPTMATIKTPGLNELLEKYKAPKGINRLKQKLHKMMGDPTSAEYFKKRPIDGEYLEYCARDVEDLVYLGLATKEGIPESVCQVIGLKYVEWGYMATK